jgi:hypothetical protein
LGNLFTSEPNSNVVRKISASSNIISVYAGITGASNTYSGANNSPATSANLYFPMDIFVLTTGLLYFTDVFNYRVRSVSTGGLIALVAGM